MNASMHGCDMPGCGKRWCVDCGERMTCMGRPTPAPRCSEHDTCTDCEGAPVYCTECAEAIAEIAQDRAEQADFDASREGL